MLEIGIFCVILLAVGYWATMFIMGRRDDVIHGKFVHAEDEGEFAPAAMPAPPLFPKRPVKAAQRPAAEPASTEAKPVNSAALQSLLAAIQQDLKSVA
ncbi:MULTISPECIES: hypothetical protein [unclassified Bradyrhizobium]|uniref:hypothetical protein n=1 Tax=Bradyrhizobium TaxID=374 RepID=UPI001CD395C1|nr:MULTISPECIES: hypothetical protein [unclassified Bradyrhizobium]MCA1498001.1 hypothetical protein [Bradyrhizobium sp. NBAIM14]MCA1531563.1 hypothetical protein [Bradyrhizobium sp. NBAIM03]